MTPAAAHPEPAATPHEEYLRSPRRSRSRPRLIVNLTSLIDVTFLLLIYFMVATTITTGEEAYRMDLPQRGAAAAQPVQPFQLDLQPLRISLSTTPDPARPYALRLEGPYPQPQSFRDLFEFLRSRQISPGVSGGLFEPDHPIIIEPTRGSRWEHAVETFNAAVRARYTNVTFARAR